MRKGITGITVLAVFIVLQACMAKTEGSGESMSLMEVTAPSQKADALAPRILVDWISDPQNGCRRQKTIDEMIFDLQYKPYEYIVALEERKDELQAQVVQEKVRELKGMVYFDLTISAGESGGELLKYKLPALSEYQSRINYFSFDMQKDLFMVQGTDTVPCALYHFERTYDIAPYSKFLLGFPVTDTKSKDLTVLFHDKTFNKGIIKFSFDKEQLSKVPKLETI